ncbi:MAG: ATP-binding cassette domain-containing protein [Rhodocyclaceae bacterium]
MDRPLSALDTARQDTSSPLVVDGLHKRYGDNEVVRGVSFSLVPGECFALLGPNGAGKTTTIRCILGQTQPTAGRITLTGESVPDRARQARRAVGVVPQTDSLDPDFTVSENLVVFARYFGIGEAEARQRIPRLLAFAGLEAKADAKVPALSGGMKRRLTMARALINDPALLVMDEPTTGLDPQARHLIWDRLKGLIAEGKTVLLTTHFMDEAERLAHRIAILDAGRIIALGTPREVIAAHIEPQVVEVFGDWAGHTGGAPAWASLHAAQFARRFEISGETAFCYVDAPRPLLDHLEDTGLRYLHRPANLEDVFLKLTGRELRDS